MTSPILIVLHQEHSSPGRVGQILRRQGYALDIRRPRFGDPLPVTLGDHAAAVVFGGPMSANDSDDWVRREIDWTALAVREGVPFLGICLGAQMLAKQLGGTIAPHPDARVEVGYYPIHPTPQGRRLLAWPKLVYHWHCEGFTLPHGATLLARGDDFPNQAFSYGPCAFGLQFHPELTLAMMNRWTVRGCARLDQCGAQPRADHFQGRALYDHEIRAWLENFLCFWLAQDTRLLQAAAE